MKLDFVCGNSQGTRQFLIGFRPDLWVPGVDQYGSFATLDPIQKVNRSNSRRLHLFILSVGSVYAEFLERRR
jgi:hypothetical protein